MSPRKYTEAVRQSNRKWDEKNLDRLSIAMPKGRKATIQSHAATQGESVNSFINRAINHEMERDRVTESPQDAVEAPTKPVQFAEGIITSTALQAAQAASEVTREAVPQFVERAVVTQAGRDRRSLAMGINPATGEKMNGDDNDVSKG